MIVVTKVEAYEYHNGDTIQIHKIPEMVPIGEFSEKGLEIQSEVVRGRRFRRNSDGLDIRIGWTSDVEKLIGFPMEAFEAKENHIEALELKVRHYEDMTFWNHIKTAFRKLRK